MDVLNRIILRAGFNSILKGFFFFYLSGLPRLLNLYSIVPIPNTIEDVANLLLGVIGWYFVIIGFNVLRPYLRLPYKGASKLLYHFYAIIVFIMVFRGYLINYDYPWLHWQSMIYFHLFEPSWLLAYLMMFFCLIPVEAIDLKPFIKYASYAAIIVIVMTLLGWNQILLDSIQQSLGYRLDEDSAKYSGIYAFFVPFFFACFCFPYIEKKKWNIVLAGFLVSFFLVLINARRSSSAISAIISVGVFLVWARNQKRNVKVLSVVLGALLVSGLLYALLRSSLLDYMLMRGLEDSRSGVDEALMSQMSPFEKIFGKGLNGRYYYYLEQEADYRNGWRYSSETGFYTLILRGGYIMAILYIVLLAIPAFKGFFKSNNALCKCLGFYISISILDLFAFGPLSFNYEFLIIWIGVAICLNPTIRRMSNEQIKEHFF